MVLYHFFNHDAPYGRASHVQTLSQHHAETMGTELGRHQLSIFFWVIPSMAGRGASQRDFKIMVKRLQMLHQVWQDPDKNWKFSRFLALKLS